jgi:ribonuclease-3
METGQLERIGEEEIKQIEQMIGYYFSDKSYLETALSHRAIIGLSNTQTLKNQQLEFLGDSIISYVVSRFLFEYYGDKDEGFMSKLRSRVVDNRNMAKVSKRLGIESLVLKVKNKDEKKQSGRLSLKILGDIFESVTGAIYLDGGMACASRFIADTLLHDIESVEKTEVDYKTNLQEWCQKKGLPLPAYTLLYSVGPEHGKSFTISVRVDELGSAIGMGSSKKEAEQSAARKLFESIEKK